MKHTVYFFLCVALFLKIAAGAPVMLDGYGQAMFPNWQDKITCDEDLRMAAESAAHFSADASLFDESVYDRFGGILALGEYGASAHFRLEKIDERWWFITPAGHIFFAIGCDAADPYEGGYSTPLYEADGKTVRSILTELPDKAEFQSAYQYNHSKINFLVANLQRKYSSDDNGDFMKTVHCVNAHRLRQWGFNATPKWGYGTCIGLPFIDDSYLGASVPRLGRYLDPFAPDFAEKAEKVIREHVSKSIDNPMLLGFSVENENGWNQETIRNLTACSSSQPAKVALVDYLIAKFGEEKAAEKFGVSNRNEMLENMVPIMLNHDDFRDFILQASRRYHEILQAIYRKVAPGVLWFGASHCAGQDDAWIEGSAPYVDCLQFNEYKVNPDWSRPLLRFCQKNDKPFFVTEFSTVCTTRGLSFYNQYVTVDSQKSRGLVYRNYAEAQASCPYCVGLGYFILYDQSPGKRALPNGEAHNFGLISQQDQPYKEMLEEVVKANERLFQLHEGKLQPFVFEDFKKHIDTRPNVALWEVLIHETISVYVREDRSSPDYFDGIGNRLTLRDDAPSASDNIMGIVDVSSQERRTPNVQLFLWFNYRGRQMEDFFRIDASEDGTTFVPLETACYLVKDGVYDRFELEPARPLSDTIRFLRIVFLNPEPKTPWATQFQDVTFAPSENRKFKVEATGLPVDFGQKTAL